MANDQRLQRLLEHYEHAAQTLRDAIALLNHGATNGNGNGNGARPSAVRIVGPASVVRKQAARLDAERRAIAWNAQAVKTIARTSRPSGSSRVKRQRELSARLLEQFDRVDPKRSKDIKGKARGMGSLVRRGYLAKKGGGYVRTDKPFSIDPNA